MSAGYRDAYPPTGPVIELAQPRLLAFLGAPLIFVGLIATVIPLVVLGPSDAIAIGLVVVLVGLVLVVVGLARGGVEHRLVIDPRGVFLVARSGAVEGVLGHGALQLTPGQYIYGARSGAYEMPCVAIGNRFAVGMNAIGTVRYRVPVPRMPRPRFYLKAVDWQALVAAVPALRSIQ